MVPRHSNSALVLCALGAAAIMVLATAFVAPRHDLPIPEVSVHVTPPVDVAPAATVELLAEPRQAPQSARVELGPVANPTFIVRATAYNSLEGQTDATPDITATGTRTRWGVVAASRDLLGTDLPYGSLVRLSDLGSYSTGRGRGAYQGLLDGMLFIVEDTMHYRKTHQIDLWFAEHADAVNWGVRRLQVEVVRYGHHGPVLDQVLAEAPAFDAQTVWLASR